VVHANGKRIWPATGARVYGRWANRFARVFKRPRLLFEYWTVHRRLQTWKAAKHSEVRNEIGVHCLINEMHVLVGNGWAHV
jgi:hypothetical protein